jgi:hypothetical protein
MSRNNLPKVGDRVNVEGREGVFFVLNADEERGCASLLPSDDGPILNEIPVDTLTILPRPDPNGATRVQ